LLLLLLLLIAPTMNANPAPDRMLFDFAASTNAAWQVVNDDVMGGVSTSSFQITNGAAVFHGELSLENNGGFASVRSKPATLTTASADNFVIRVRGDGRRYQFTARMSQNFDRALYQGAFTTRKGEWLEHRLPLKDFVPSLRGRTLTTEPPLTAEQLTSVGFLIANQQAGPFRLEIAWIKMTRSISK